jgi:hypothetical protein
MAGRVGRCRLARVALAERAARPTMGTPHRTAVRCTLVVVAVVVAGTVPLVGQAGITKVRPTRPQARLEPLAPEAQQAVEVAGRGLTSPPRSMKNTMPVLGDRAAGLALKGRGQAGRAGLVRCTTGLVVGTGREGLAGQTAVPRVAHTAAGLVLRQVPDTFGPRKATQVARFLLRTLSISRAALGPCG